MWSAFCFQVRYSRVPRLLHPSGCRGRVPADTDTGEPGGNGALYTGADEIKDVPPGASHPLVWVTPAGDGRRHDRAVLVSPMWVASLENRSTGKTWNDVEAQMFIEAVLSVGRDSEIAHRWEVGDFAVWDNRALLHTATPNDRFPPDGLRLLHRIRLKGTAAPLGSWEPPS